MPGLQRGFLVTDCIAPKDDPERAKPPHQPAPLPHSDVGRITVRQLQLGEQLCGDLDNLGAIIL